MDPVPEDIQQLIQPKDPYKIRLGNMNSHESKATVFTNGHHKPVHKFNDAHNQLGTPYKIPSRSHTIHGHREIAQRSTDSLPLTKFSKPFHESPLHHSVTEAVDVVRRVKSEHNSPVLSPTFISANDPLRDFTLPSFDPNAYSYSPFSSDSPVTQQSSSQQDLPLPERFPESWFMTYEQAHDYQPPMAALTETPAVDWSTFNMDHGRNIYDVNGTNSPFAPGQEPPYSSFEPYGPLGPAALASSSGELSEVEDYAQPSVPNHNVRSTSNEASNDFSSIGGDDISDRYRLSSASSYYGTPQANMLANDNLTSLDIDEVLKQAEAETRKIRLQNHQQQMQQMQLQQEVQQKLQRMSTPSQTSTPNTTTSGEHPFTIREAQQYARMNGMLDGNNLKSLSNMPPTSMAEDPMWSVGMENPESSLDDSQEDEDWVR